jgi:hypothetical protein
MDRARFLFIVSGLFLVVVLALGLMFFLVPGSVPKGIFGHVTVSGDCALVGDNPPCGTVALSEVVSLINQWVGGHAILSDVIKLINAWSNPPVTTTTSTTTTSTSSTTTTTLSLVGVQLFTQDYFWNVPIDNLPVDPRSDEYIITMNASGYLRPSLGFPYNVVDSSTPKYNVTFHYDWVSDKVLYPIPDNPLIEGADSVESCEGDCHVLIVDKDKNFLYELFSLNRTNGTWTAGSGAVWNLSNYSLRPKGLVSADAAGLSMLPGIMRYEEIEAGEIKHAIRFTTPLTQNKYVWPARAWTSNNANTSYPMFGQRFRLKASFNISSFPAEEKVILTALKKYGMILADNGPQWWICGTDDSRWPDHVYSFTYLRNVHGSDFELINESSLMIDENSGQAAAFGAESNPTGNPIGGGEGYSDIFTESDPRVSYVVSNRQEFLAALNNSVPSDVIFVPEDADINLTGLYDTIISGGLTIAGDRGYNGSLGGRIFRNRDATDPSGDDWNTYTAGTLVINGNNVRITGLRIEGPDSVYADHFFDGFITGILIPGAPGSAKGLVVDNNEISGWSYGGVIVLSFYPTNQAEGLASAEIGSSIANIHHNYFHNIWGADYGYGVGVGGYEALIKANLFDNTRHSVAATGLPNEGYEFSYNIQLNLSTASTIDVHGYPSDGGIAGTLYRIHHNTIKSNYNHAIGIRGAPKQDASINYNSLKNCTVNCYAESYNAVVQFGYNGTNMTMENNLIDATYWQSGPIGKVE